MIKLINSNNIDLSIAIKNLSPRQYEPLQVVNNLLDGTLHVQILGEASSYYTFDILASANQVGLIDIARNKGEVIKLLVDSDEISVLIIEKPEWARMTSRQADTRLYTSSIKAEVIGGIE